MSDIDALKLLLLKAAGHTHGPSCEEPELEVDAFMRPWRTGHSGYAHDIASQAVLLDGEYAEVVVLTLAAQCVLSPHAVDFLLAAPGVGNNRRIGPVLEIIKRAHIICAERRSWSEHMAGEFGKLINGAPEMRTVKLTHSLLTLAQITALTQCLADERPLPVCCTSEDGHVHQCAVNHAFVAMLAQENASGTDDREASGDPSPEEQSSPPAPQAPVVEDSRMDLVTAGN